MTDEKIIKYKKSLKGRYTGMTEKIANEIGLPKKKVEKIEDKVNMDLNNDGVVDKKDASIAGKVLANSRKKKNTGGD